MALSTAPRAVASRRPTVASATREVLADLWPGEVIPLDNLVERVSIALDGAAVKAATVTRAARLAAERGLCGRLDWYGELVYCRPELVHSPAGERMARFSRRVR